MAFFDEWKEKWESWSQAVKGAVIGGVLLLLVGVGGLLPKKEEAVEESEALVTTVLAEKTEENTTLEAVIFVDIKGEVKKPGVYQMKVGDRVKDALDAAGGLTAEADSQKVNLAQRVEDQMVIVVPKVGEEAEAIPAGATSKEVSKEGKVNINTATVEELKTLKGVGEKKAEAIIEYRKKNGSFKTKEDLMKVRGIGKKLFESFEERIVTQ
ncbi:MULTISPECIES: helix-hairpin-helix domain-containing protein [unclassified Granulicatella]|uniref:helix-hairpin-helix domain-containing protein n=1 Tax=unclassified Granulicatella TaxID=2630493 RepID=UPI0025564679|nr:MULTISPECIES: helix-hairpin-helix domain-containing protein [unclassified Granulicatella]MDK8381371.1 helix-hairpin-helix domain-containing protein [Granulicatella sp. UMB5615B]MDK8523353.1 helix-hairpin-helix domain-containing protein [Granulicatella sp. UMB5615A]